MKKFSSSYSELTFLAAPWIEYELGGEKKFCQPDFILLSPSSVHVIEAKLTRCADGFAQLHRLYKPLVQIIWPEREIFLCQAFSNWAGAESPAAVHTIAAALATKLPYIDLHWKPDHDAT